MQAFGVRIAAKGRENLVCLQGCLGMLDISSSAMTSHGRHRNKKYHNSEEMKKAASHFK